jgi:hypothetical protein
MGMNQKASYLLRFLKFESHYPPLRGIVQLTNSDL